MNIAFDISVTSVSVREPPPQVKSRSQQLLPTSPHPFCTAGYVARKATERLQEVMLSLVL